MKALAAMLVMALLSGCAAQSPQAQSQQESGAQEEPYLERPLPDTSKIYFTVEPMPDPTEGPGLPTFDFTNITDEEGRLRVHLFYLPECPACKAIAPEIDVLEDRYPQAVFLRYDISTINGSHAYKAYAEERNLSPEQRFVPQALVNGTVITDRFNINKSLEGIVASFSG